MGMVSERYNVEQTLKTVQFLKELDETNNIDLKKVYNIKLVNWLEAQESQSEVYATF